MNTIFANQRRDTRNRLLRNVSLLVVGTAVALALGDVAVRLLDIPPRPMAALPVPNYQRSDNPLIGYEYIPNYEPSDAPFDPSHAGFRTISEGFRDHAYPRKKPDDTYRIVVLRRQPQRAALPPLAAMPEAAVMEIPLAAATYPSRATPKAKLDHPPARYTAEH